MLIDILLWLSLGRGFIEVCQVQFTQRLQCHLRLFSTRAQRNRITFSYAQCEDANNTNGLSLPSTSEDLDTSIISPRGLHKEAGWTGMQASGIGQSELHLS